MIPSFFSSCISALLTLLLVLPGPAQPSQSSGFTIQKSVKINKEGDLLYPIRVQKKSWNQIDGIPWLEEPINPNVRISAINPLPDSWWTNSRHIKGYPEYSQYGEIKKLAWVFPEKQNCISQSAAPSFGYRYNNHYRDDLLYFPQTKVTALYEISLDTCAPIVDRVKGKQYLFLSGAEGVILCLEPRTLQMIWRYNFPLGESASISFVTFVQNKQTYLLCATNRSNLYLFNAENGSILWKKSFEGLPTAPLQVMTFNETIYCVMVTNQSIILLNPISREYRFERKISQSTNFSPLLMMLSDQLIVVLSYPDGSLEALNTEGNLIWQTGLKGEITYDSAGFVKEGTLYIVTATTQQTAYLISGKTGAIVSESKLPGKPRSPLSLVPEDYNYSLLVSQGPEDTGNSYFVSDFFHNPAMQKTILSIPGRSFLGLVGMKTMYFEYFFALTNDYKLIILDKKQNALMKPYPVLLFDDLKPLRTFLEGRDITLTDGAIFVNLHEMGLLILGRPLQGSLESSLHSGGANTSEDYALDGGTFSGSRFRTDLDYMPEQTMSFQKIWDVTPHDNTNEMTSPLSFYHPFQQKWMICMPDKTGNIHFLDQKGDSIKKIELGIGPIYTPPIITFLVDGSLVLFVVSNKTLLKLTLDETFIKMKVIWQKDDLGSYSASFNRIKFSGKEVLLLIDSFSYLTSVSVDTGEIFFREKVDASSFSVSFDRGSAFVFCGSKAINLLTGDIIWSKGCPGSESTVIGFQGTTLLFQSDDLDLICLDFTTRETLWRVRKLWCKAYCFDYKAPAVYRMGNFALCYLADYTRIICMDVSSGLIRWIYNASDDFFVSKPTVIEVEGRCFVYAGSIKGRLYAFDGFNGERVSGYPILLPGKEEEREILKGISSPIICNGCILISRVETGFFLLGAPKPTNRRYFPVDVLVKPKKKRERNPIFNRAIFFWERYFQFSKPIKTN